LLLSAGLGVAAPPAQAVDINQATAAQLEGLRGIGPRTADIIVRERERGGRFESLDDLSERVRGIGQKKAQALQAAGLTIGAAGVAPKSAAAAAPAARPAPGKAAAAKPAGASTAGGAPVPARAKP
jgi:competence protein ComEA